MNIKMKFKRTNKGAFAKFFVIGLMAVLGVLANVNLLAVYSPESADIIISEGRVHRSSLLESVNYSVRHVTAYNVGDRYQTDKSPCVSATNENVCRVVARGGKICAANFVPLNSYLYIQNYGICRVADRMSRRFENRVDIAMEAKLKKRARKFGVENLEVGVLE
jgi:3D (Asp-Asp-Asp) domain-containing protein